MHFTRHVFVAGPLSKLGVGVYRTAQFFKRFEVLINKRLVFQTSGGGGVEPRAPKGNFVHWGDNLFEVIAYKKPFTHGFTCSKDRTGISFVFSGSFATDMSLPNPPKEVYDKGRHYLLAFSVLVRNNGPGGLAAGWLRIRLVAPEGELSGVSKLTLPSPSPPLIGCTQTQNGREYARDIACRLANFRRGVSIAPDFVFEGIAPNTFTDARISLYSQLTGGNQIGNSADNVKTDVYVFCAEKTTDPKCPK